LLFARYQDKGRSSLALAQGSNMIRKVRASGSALAASARLAHSSAISPASSD